MNTSNMKLPDTHPDEFTCFAVVVDGEVASYLTLPNKDELHVAIYSSAPTFIKVPYAERPARGSQWDGKHFVSVD